MGIFEETYGRLNAKQKEAVDTIDGPVMVIAGPGTGKTTILTLRIANIVRQTDTPPSAILALTFTEAGVRAMRKKLLAIMGPRAYEVRIHTFHSFANELLKRFPEAFPRIIGAEHMEDLEQIRIVEEILKARRSPLLRPKNHPTYYVRPIIDEIKKLKQENVSPERLAKILAGVSSMKKEGGERAARNRNRELARVYAAYEKMILRRRLYDFEDMIGEVARELRGNSEFRLRIQEEYQYVLADEHQDANAGQNELLERLSDYDDRPNLFIVGDEKQAIFRFQGASLENFLYFKRRFPRARVIVLDENYRSQPTVLAAAHSLIKKNPAPDASFRVPLRATASHPPQNIRIVEAGTARAELQYIGESIKRRVVEGSAPREIAVLVRENADARKVEKALLERGIPVLSGTPANALEHARIGAFRTFLEAVHNPTDDAALGKALFFDFLALPPLPVLSAVSARDRRGSLLSALPPELRAFREKLLSWHRAARNESLVDAFEEIARESGFLRHLLSRPDASEALPLYDAFLESVKRVAERDKRATVGDFLERLSRAEEHGIGIVSDESLGAEGGVRVMTVHKAKGLEFDTVYIAFALDGKWGGRRTRALFSLPIYAGGEKEEDVSEERRLFYVALTRARKEAIITWHATGEDGRDRLPARFIHEIEEDARSHLSHTADTVSPIALLETPSRRPALVEKEFLNALFLERGLSVTHLNNFLLCPLKYFFLDLIRIPRAQSLPELYGSAVHAALAAHFNAYARDEDRPLKETTAIFEGALRRTHLGLRDFRTWSQAGKKEISAYLSAWTFPRAILNEYRIAGVPIVVGSTVVELSGMLDKVEFLSDGVVNVVDYKTGKPKSRNELLGKTKNADGNYYRQLVFYKVLLDGYAGGSPARAGKWRMKTGTIDFLKPDERGRHHREVFEISDGEARDLKAQAADVASQILALSFLDKGCDACEWCELKKLSAVSFS
ncbi:MAG: DNA helicase II / ATP-dependent DNA helicase PcrA [Parcubacteria group bacterium Gr01-1014_72]|nr:MAG: DNA helicase II / ATP-dependent DNA helicase PcrA [Parcubacteria group bacterium Gr01-1014_72]